ncbi:Heptahelical transmembrane protein ADIPOR3 [Linum perenne]
MVGDGYEKLGPEEPNYEDGKKAKGKKGKYYQLIDYNALPSFMKDNEYIHRYYRAEWSLKHLLFSIFTIHNETLNIWTHLAGFFLFFSLTVCMAMKAPDVVDLNVLRNSGFYKQVVSCLPSLPNMQHLQRFRFTNWSLVKVLNNCLPDSFVNNYHPTQSLLQGDDGGKDAMNNAMLAPLLLEPITRWPFYAFMVGAMFCLLASTICHLLSCHSERMSYIVHRFDYAGIAALIATSFYPPVYYSFMCNPFFCNLYLGVITVMGIVTIIFSLLPTFQRPEFRSFRASLFFGMGVSGVAPILHKMVLYGNQPEALQTTGYEVLMGVLYGLGALIYAKRVPERWMPGKFDIVGQSHQLFHILVVAAAFTHYQAGLVYLKWRDSNGC